MPNEPGADGGKLYLSMDGGMNRRASPAAIDSILKKPLMLLICAVLS
jgi:hypothetical protein